MPHLKLISPPQVCMRAHITLPTLPLDGERSGATTPSFIPPATYHATRGSHASHISSTNVASPYQLSSSPAKCPLQYRKLFMIEPSPNSSPVHFQRTSSPLLDLGRRPLRVTRADPVTRTGVRSRRPFIGSQSSVS